MKHHALIVLDALLKGHPVTLDGRTFRLGQRDDESGHWVFGWVPDRIVTTKDGVSEEMLVPPDKVYGTGQWTIDWFVTACEKLTTEEIMVLGASVVLTEGTRQ